MLDTPHPEEIINGEITDYCCILSKRTLSELKLADAEVVVEASVRRLPVGINRAFLYGVNDVALLADSKGIRLIGLRDGDIFLADEPVLLAQGRASDIAINCCKSSSIIDHDRL